MQQMEVDLHNFSAPAPTKPLPQTQPQQHKAGGGTDSPIALIQQLGLYLKQTHGRIAAIQSAPTAEEHHFNVYWEVYKWKRNLTMLADQLRDLMKTSEPMTKAWLSTRPRKRNTADGYHIALRKKKVYSACDVLHIANALGSWRLLKHPHENPDAVAAEVDEIAAFVHKTIPSRDEFEVEVRPTAQAPPESRKPRQKRKREKPERNFKLRLPAPPPASAPGSPVGSPRR